MGPNKVDFFTVNLCQISYEVMPGSVMTSCIKKLIDKILNTCISCPYEMTIIINNITFLWQNIDV